MTKISIVLPCLNEESAIIKCLDSIISVTKDNKFDAEIIVVDNNSKDKTFEYAKTYSNKFENVTLLREDVAGYGSTLMKGLDYANGDFIFMADCDNTYDFSEMPLFIDKLEEGYDMVIGNRFSKKMAKNVMPFHRKHIGNPFLSFLTRKLFKINIQDIHCGARAFKREAYEKLSLRTVGMEFASEMIIKSSKNKLKITEVDINYGPRIGESKLNSLVDGWRHLRFMLLYSPIFLFLLPGILSFFSGISLIGIFYFFNPKFFGLTFYFHPMFLFFIMTVLGYQLIFFAVFSKIYAITHLGEVDENFNKLFKIFTIENCGIMSFVLILAGSAIFYIILSDWVGGDFKSINQINNSFVAATLIVIGIQTLFSGFMLSILGIKEK